MSMAMTNIQSKMNDFCLKTTGLWVSDAYRDGVREAIQYYMGSLSVLVSPYPTRSADNDAWNAGQKAGQDVVEGYKLGIITPEMLNV